MMAPSDETKPWALRNARIATMERGAAPIPNGVLVARDDVILAVSADEAILSRFDCAHVVDLEGRLVTPGLIDCHTHLVHGGNRANEFEMRLAGASYEEIARAGGGIVSTVTATRAADEDSLTASALARLGALQAEGVTTLEIKSGYGLDLPTEMRMLRVARKLGQVASVSVKTSYLGAHAVPSEFAGDADGYIDRVCADWLPAITAEGLADAVDGFCESIAFDVPQIERLFQAAAVLGLPVKLHADQLSNGHGAALAARHKALSADHLEYTDAAGVAAMAAAGTVAVMLPGAFYFLSEKQRPPIEEFRRHGVPMAVATDCNPGSSPLTSPLLAMNLAATQFRMTIEECLAGMTREAAVALGIGESTGTITAGKSCDLAIWDVARPAELVYRMGYPSLHARVWQGHWQSVAAP